MVGGRPKDALTKPLRALHSDDVLIRCGPFSETAIFLVDSRQAFLSPLKAGGASDDGRS